MEGLESVEAGLELLQKFRRVYLATPYSKVTDGIDVAADNAAWLAGELLKHKVRVFSPIAHSHAIAMAAGVDPLDPELWKFADEPWLEACEAMIVGMFPGWVESSGVNYEIGQFMGWNRHIFYMHPQYLTIDRSYIPYPKPPQFAQSMPPQRAAASPAGGAGKWLTEFATTGGWQ